MKFTSLTSPRPRSRNLFWKKSLLILALSATALSGIDASADCGGSTAGGTIVGGVLGAAVGRQFGRGSGRDAATILGAVGGAIAGSNVNQNMNNQDCANQRAAQQPRVIERQVIVERPVVVAPPPVVIVEPSSCMSARHGIARHCKAQPGGRQEVHCYRNELRELEVSRECRRGNEEILVDCGRATRSYEAESACIHRQLMVGYVAPAPRFESCRTRAENVSNACASRGTFERPGCYNLGFTNLSASHTLSPVCRNNLMESVKRCESETFDSDKNKCYEMAIDLAVD